MEFGLPIEICQLILRFRTQLICKDIHAMRRKTWQKIHDEMNNEHEIYCDTNTWVPVRFNYAGNQIWSRQTHYPKSMMILYERFNFELRLDTNRPLEWVLCNWIFIITNSKGISIINK